MITLLLSEVLIFYAIFAYLLWIWRRRHLYYVSWKLEGPTGLPFIGNLLDILKNRHRILDYSLECSEKYASPPRMWMGPFFVVHLTDPEDLKDVLNHPNALEKTYAYSFGSDFVDNCLLLAKVPVWKQHRQLMQPSFGTKLLESYLETFDQKAKELCEKLHSKEGKTIDIFDDICLYNMDVTCETFLDTKVDGLNGNPFAKTYLETTEKLFLLLFNRATRLWLYPNFIFRRTGFGKQMQECIKIFHSFSKGVLAEKTEKWHQILSVPEKYNNNDRKCLLDNLIVESMLRPQESLTQNEIRSEIDITLGAGTDTSAFVISFILLMLAQHPEIQEEVYQELLEAKNNNQKLDRFILSRLHRTEEVINETLRLFPPTPYVARDLTGDVELTNKNLVLTEGTTVSIGIRDLHRSTRVWGQDAHLFRPSRFGPEESKTRHPYAFLPFSGGPRNCVGMKFAKLSIKVALLRILSEFRVETDEKFEDIKCIMNLLNHKVGGWKIRLIKR